MKNIDPKSVLIGVLGTALVIACTDSSKPTSIIPEAKAATGVNDKWDDKQKWELAHSKDQEKIIFDDGSVTTTEGWEPFQIHDSLIMYRKRIK